MGGDRRQDVPYTNYWHLKNYYRDEEPSTGSVRTHPAPLEFGTINYRKAIAMALDAGFRGAFCVEHYGGDSISVGATNREYIRRVLPKENPVPAVQQRRCEALSDRRRPSR